jgi:hypothetical protein
LQNNLEQTNLSKLLQNIVLERDESKPMSCAHYEVSSTFKKPAIKKLFADLLQYYKDTYMTKSAHFFNECLLVMLRDFEICPFITPLKDNYVIYCLISSPIKFKDTTNVS